MLWAVNNFQKGDINSLYKLLISQVLPSLCKPDTTTKTFFLQETLNTAQHVRFNTPGESSNMCDALLGASP